MGKLIIFRKLYVHFEFDEKVGTVSNKDWKSREMLHEKSW